MELPKVFILSPVRMLDRRKVIDQHMKEVGVEPIYFNGLYGDDMKLMSGYNCERDYGFYKNMKSSMVCLSLNHWFLWQHIVLAGLTSAIILEDDAKLPMDFKDYYQEMMDKTPSDWEMVYMSILFPDRIGEGKILAEKVDDNVWRHIKAKFWDGACDGLHAYVMSQSAAKKLTDISLWLDEPMDRWISFNGLPMFKTYIWTDSRVSQRSQGQGKEQGCESTS